MDGVDHINAEINAITCWPEAVTFEEMNERGPGPLERIMLKVAHKNHKAT